MPDIYCTREDQYAHGLPRGALANPGRMVSDINTSTGVYTLDGHGFEGPGSRTAVTFRTEDGGTQQTGITAGTTYYAEALTDSTFQVYAASSGGSAMAPAAAGSLVVVVAPMADLREYYSRWVDSFFPAHAVPFQAPYPAFIVGITAQLANYPTLAATGQRSESLKEIETAAAAQIKRFAAGLPLRSDLATPRTNTAVSSYVSTGLGAFGPTDGTLP